jgi:hypothetical protein
MYAFTWYPNRSERVKNVKRQDKRTIWHQYSKFPAVITEPIDLIIAGSDTFLSSIWARSLTKGTGKSQIPHMILFVYEVEFLPMSSGMF